MSPSHSAHSRIRGSTSKQCFSLLALALAPCLAQAASQLSFFEHSSCNAGTSVSQYEDPNALQADTTCHQVPNATVAMYVDQIDQGCSLRIYLSTDCDASAFSLAGLLIGAGTCFYVEEGVELGSWRPDCPNVDYSSTDGADTGNSYSNGQDDGGANVEAALVTATGAVTLTAASSPTSSEEASSAAAATTTAPLIAAPSSAPSTTAAGSASPTTTGTSAATSLRRGRVAGLVLSLAAISAVLL